jgi:hypothetical protein
VEPFLFIGAMFTGAGLVAVVVGRRLAVSGGRNWLTIGLQVIGVLAMATGAVGLSAPLW